MKKIRRFLGIIGSMLEYKNGIVNQILRGVGLGALAQRWLAD